jgi:DNA-binding transcriptional LysR family regulator
MVADWTTISSLATAGGTLILALATFSAVRSSNRSARVAESALQINLRPLLFPSHDGDRTERIMWVDKHWAEVRGGHASVEIENGTIYLAMSLRNAGSGVAVLQSWYVIPHFAGAQIRELPPIDEFRPQTRDLYVPAGDVGLWQGAIRDRDDPVHAPLVEAIQEPHIFNVLLLYSDHEGGQRTISRFSVSPDEGSVWTNAVVLHWNLDRPDPRG